MKKVIAYIFDALLAKVCGFAAGYVILNYLTQILKKESFWNNFEFGYFVEVSSTTFTVITFVISAIAAALFSDIFKSIFDNIKCKFLGRMN